MNNHPKLTEIAWNVDEPTYRADAALSYSTLASYERGGFSSITTLGTKKSSESLTFGSVVDTILTDGMQAFNERFIVADMPVMSDSLRQIGQYLYDNYNDIYDSLEEIPDETLSDTGTMFNFYKDAKYKNYRVKLIRENCTLLYELLRACADKELISSTMYDDALACIEILRTDPMTSEYFSQEDDGLERYYQLKFKGEFEGIPIRCMSDLLIVDHSRKLVYLKDLKTSGHKEYEFFKSFLDWNYDIQAQMYWYLIRQNMDKHPVFKNYKLTDMEFLVVNRETRKPLAWYYKDTTSTVSMTYGRRSQILRRNWRIILKELYTYLNAEVPYRYPIGIKKHNSITDYLNEL